MPLDDEMGWLYFVFFCISLVEYQVGRIPFNQQIRNFESTLDQITDNLGADNVADAIAKCIFFVGMGSNDYLNNYLMPNYATRNQYNGQQFANLLIQQYNRQLNVRFICLPTVSLHHYIYLSGHKYWILTCWQTLYNLGARRFVLAGLGIMGCIPSILAQSPTSRCSDDVNHLILPFNANVRAMVNRLNSNLPGAKFIYIDVYRMFQDILSNSRNYGIFFPF